MIAVAVNHVLEQTRVQCDGRSVNTVCHISPRMHFVFVNLRLLSYPMFFLIDLN